MLRYLAILACASLTPAGAADHLSNGKITARFNGRGLASIADTATRATWHLSKDEFSLTLSGQSYTSESLGTPGREEAEGSITYLYTAGPYRIDVVYEVPKIARFVTKRIVISAPKGRFRLDEIVVFRQAVVEPIREAYPLRRGRENLGTGDYGAFLRFERARGLLVAAQNPFLSFQHAGADFSVGYRPAMDWDMSWGPFEADRGLIAPYQSSGRTVPEKMLPEWALGPIDETPGMDEAEVEAFTEAVRGSLLYKPSNPLNLMVGWCANDYQIDIATAEGRTEYKRILDMAANLGAEHVLFAPANSAVSRREESRDDWKWEYVLWLGLGQKIRRNQWDPASGAIPEGVQEMLAYARSRKLGLLAYVYPVLGFEQNREWLVGPNGNRANLGIHSLQNWLIEALEGFYRHTGITGYAFDHTFLGLEGASKYAQFWGWRRVMETLRRDIPEIVIDGRQAYQNYGPWIWLAGSYPHPTSTDEQPESFVSFPDLKLDRVSADRQRYTAYRYRNYEFAPSEIVPGFITHQTARNDDSGHMPEAMTPAGQMALPFRQRDWDYLGWRYSLLSSIAISGWNNVLNLIPARDTAEFQAFSDEDKKWFLHWIDWTDAHKDYLRHTRTIMGQPAVGKTDGTAAILDDNGFLFLFNPNGRRLTARFTLDETIGLTAKGKYALKELFPLERRLPAKAGSAFWNFGDEVTREMDGGSAVVLEIEPAAPGRDPQLFNAPGRSEIEDGNLRITEVRGEAGTSENLLVAVPSSGRIKSASVNGKEVAFTRNRAGLIEIPVTFAGAPFRHYQQIDTYNPQFTGGKISASVRIPRRVFDQLAARRKAWPIPWTAEDYRSTWLAPERLLLFVQLAEPDDRWNAALRIDGNVVELKKAYASVRANRRNFVGFYADVSDLSADQEHRFEIELPSPLKAGQFQGLFFENVETEYTPEIAAKSVQR